MAHYYTRRRVDLAWGEINGPFKSYDAAMNDHTNVTSRGHDVGQMQTFIDLATVVGDERQTIELLWSDPVLRTVFDLGRRHGIDERGRT